MHRVYIAIQEPLAVELMLHRMAFSLIWQGGHLTFGCNTAKAYLCNQGGTSFSLQTSLPVLYLVEKHGITLIPAFIPTHLNVEANNV